MAIDASIYQNIRPTQIDVPNPMDVATKALTLGQLGLQNQQMQQQMATTQAVRSLYAKHTGADGQVDKNGFLSDLAKVNPQAALSYQEQFGKADKGTADAQGAQMDSMQKVLGQTMPSMNYLAGLPEEQRSAQYNDVMKQLAQQGIPMNNIPKDAQGNFLYDPGHFKQSFGMMQDTAASLAAQKTKAETQKTYADIGMVPAQRNAELYGSRSPNNTLTESYNKDIAPVKASQIAMRQMTDNYKNPSPQGDKSLVLNAFRIKFPNAPDVNSLEELTKAQSVPDTWRQMAASALQGGLDQPTRDNLMRDGISTYRANYGTYQDTAQKYQAMAKERNVPLGGMTNEPALDSTMKEASNIQDKIGPYVPPTQRSGSILGSVGSMLGMGGPKSANASTTPPQSGGFSISEIKAELARRKGGKGN